jgi:hypothetical protein
MIRVKLKVVNFLQVALTSVHAIAYVMLHSACGVCIMCAYVQSLMTAAVRQPTSPGMARFVLECK